MQVILPSQTIFSAAFRMGAKHLRSRGGVLLSRSKACILVPIQPIMLQLPTPLTKKLSVVRSYQRIQCTWDGLDMSHTIEACSRELVFAAGGERLGSEPGPDRTHILVPTSFFSSVGRWTAHTAFWFPHIHWPPLHPVHHIRSRISSSRRGVVPLTKKPVSYYLLSKLGHLDHHILRISGGNLSINPAKPHPYTWTFCPAGCPHLVGRGRSRLPRSCVLLFRDPFPRALSWVLISAH